MNKTLWVTLCLLSLALAGCGSVGPGNSTTAPGTPIVRVLLLDSRQRADIRCDTTLTVLRNRTPVLRLGESGTFPVTFGGNTWRLGTATLPAGELTLSAEGGGLLSVDRMSYRGRLRLLPVGADRFNVINDVDIESYLQGVVSRELLHDWLDEAYRAQAVAARTYALYEARTVPAGRAFDLYCDQRSQVYGGVAAESAVGRHAVDATRGIVLAFGPAGQERIFKAYFSSCCGGVTQSAADAFGDPPQAELSARRVGPRCAVSPHFNWPAMEIAKSELTRRVRAWGVSHNRPEAGIGSIARLDIQFINRFSRPVRFVLTDNRGQRYSLLAEDLRQAFNTSATDGVVLKSSFFKPVDEPTKIRIVDGHGFGHGVGLCQWCAQVEAQQGRSHETILADAYPGAVLVRAY